MHRSHLTSLDSVTLVPVVRESAPSIGATVKIPAPEGFQWKASSS